jgi:murein DD-endopeptidase MepM/ murein hydrolase activator NlpD
MRRSSAAALCCGDLPLRLDGASPRRASGVVHARPVKTEQLSPHGANQKFAWDFGAVDTGVAVLAARGGVVAKFDDTFPDKANKSDPNPDPCGGNFIYIRDQSGTFAVYYHEKQNQISPFITKGHIVHRGQKRGETGLSGCTGGSHVHFEATTGLSSNWLGIRRRFHMNVKNPSSGQYFEHICHIPRHGKEYQSTNVLHVH